MKHKYLSLIALAGAMFMSTSVWAQWDEPTIPELEKKNATELVSGKTYYIMNVGAEQFITGANSWSTQISLTIDGVTSELDSYSPALAIYVADSTQTFSGVTVSGYSMRLDGTFTVYGASGGRSFTNTYLFRDSEESGFMDHGAQAKGYIWNITKAENGYYRIQTAEGDPSFPDAATQYAGWDNTNGPIAVDEFGELIPNDDYEVPSTVVAFNMTGEYENECIDWMFIDAAAYMNQLAAYEARVTLYDLLYEAADAGVNTDAATAVYNNPNATKEQLESAYATLKADINRAYFLDMFTGATEEDPMDVTEYAIENPNFDDTMDGWTITVGGQNLQRQARTDGVVDESQNWVSITNFIEAWTPAPNHLGDGTISQTVYGLPQGKYMLECDAMATLQGGSPSAEEAVENAFIFIQGDNSEVRNPIKSPDTQPKHWTVTFLNPSGNNALTFGLKVENTTANWISADNFRLWYYGEFEGSEERAKLTTAITKAASAVEMIESGINPANRAVEDAFQQTLADAQAVAATETDDDSYIAAREALEAALATYEASVKAYEKLAAFIGADGSACKLDEYMDVAAGLGDLYDIFTPWEEELKNGFYDGVITTERIEELMASFLPKIREYIKRGSIEPGTDLTMLLDNPDFSEGNGRNLTGNAVPGWTITGIDGGSLTELRHQTGNIETWHNKFDFSQTITDMPAGIYDITVQGFVRHDDGGPTDLAYFKAGDSEKSLMTLEDQWSFEQIYGPDQAAMGDTNRDSQMTTPAGETAYKCNGMTGAYYWFQTPIPDDLYPTFKYKAPSDQDWTGDNYYTNHIKVVLKQAGDFTISLGTTSGTDWMIWDNFKIKYIGEDLEIYAQMVNEEYEKLMEVYQAEDAFITKKAADDVVAVTAKVENARNIQNGEEALALIEEIDQIMAYITAGNKAGSDLTTTYYLYDETMMMTYSSSDQTFPALLAEVRSSIENPLLVADNDAIEALINALKAGWVKYVMADHIANASEENPEDVTEAIFNYNYSDYDLDVDNPTNSNGWTNEGSNGSTVFESVYYNEIEFYNTNFNHYQTIRGLEPGWYIVANDAFYRAGDAAAMTTAYNDSVPAINSYMYAVVAGDTVAVEYLHSMFDGKQIDPTGSNGEITVTLNTETEEGEVEPMEYYIPNLMGSAMTYLELEDLETGEKYYTNRMAVEVKEDGVLTIGVRKDELITNDWTVIANWQLYYVGKNEPTAVESLDAAKQGVKVAQFFAVDGRQQSRLQRGINIVRMADGSVQKVMVK